MYLYENLENEYLEDLEKTGTHKRRLVKITMYLDVPSLSTDKNTGITTFKTESDIENEIEKIVSKSLSKNDIYTTSPSDIMVSPIESDDPSNFKTPVGYLSPDGKFYLIESEENGLAHLELAHRVYDLYRDYIKENRIFRNGKCLLKKIECLGCREGTAREKAKVIWELRHEFKISLLIEVAGIPRSTYYYYVKHRNDEDKYYEIKEEISSIYTKNKGRYGYLLYVKE